MSKVTPLLIVKLLGNEPIEAKRRLMETVAEGIKNGALVISSDCEIIAFDCKGRLAYPPARREEV